MNRQLHELLAQVAAMYYLQDMTQAAIGDKLGLSRVKVYRLIKQAREAGIVQISINWPTTRNHALEVDLCETFGLKEALVMLVSPVDQAGLLASLGRLAAGYLEQLLHQAPTLAVCLGRATYETINAVSSDIQANVRIAQAVGSLPNALREYDSASLVRQLSEKLGGDVVYLSSPPMADSTEAAAVIRRQRQIKHALTAASTATVALVGIGNLDPATAGYVQSGLVAPQELEALVAAGAVGDIAWQIYNQDGELFPCEINQRVIGITLDELRHIPTTIAVAQGAEKVKAILGGLRTGVIDVLCTDDRTAAGVLKLAQAGSS